MARSKSSARLEQRARVFRAAIVNRNRVIASTHPPPTTKTCGKPEGPTQVERALNLRHWAEPGATAPCRVVQPRAGPLYPANGAIRTTPNWVTLTNWFCARLKGGHRRPHRIARRPRSTREL